MKRYRISCSLKLEFVLDVDAPSYKTAQRFFISSRPSMFRSKHAVSLSHLNVDEDGLDLESIRELRPEEDCDAPADVVVDENGEVVRWLKDSGFKKGEGHD